MDGGTGPDRGGYRDQDGAVVRARRVAIARGVSSWKKLASKPSSFGKFGNRGAGGTLFVFSNPWYTCTSTTVLRLPKLLLSLYVGCSTAAFWATRHMRRSRPLARAEVASL